MVNISLLTERPQIRLLISSLATASTQTRLGNLQVLAAWRLVG